MRNAGEETKREFVDIDKVLAHGPSKWGYSGVFISDGVMSLCRQLEGDPDEAEKLAKLAKHCFFAVESITAGLSIVGHMMTYAGDDLPPHGNVALGELIEELSGIMQNQASNVCEIAETLAKKGGAK